ncbi:MAG: KR domain-containing protein, partial [Rhodobacterales bacterium]|nr:KR domain-containing protein [Rhodobacterales bacterium]
AAGEDPARMARPDYVPAAAVLDGFHEFDADFFGLSPKDAAIMDPQHRQFLEVAWEALEDAGHPPESFAGRVGVYAGCGMGSYFYFNLCSNRDLVDGTGMFLLRHTGNDKDFLATRVSHIFDLRGPSLNIQTACSTSLVAVHVAAQALLAGECDMAIAGGVTIELPHGRGYVHVEGEILSPDGHCHAFDHRAQGTVFGSGAGAVVLRRLADALADGDHVWAVIRGSAVNNDGAAKAGYLAPSVDGQAACVAEALAVAGVPADSVDYVECHGTGTYLGDPIEVAALTAAFRQTSAAVGTTRIGSVKTNIGHLDTAAGVASLIKVSLALHHGEIPPSLGYEAPNPAIDLDTSPFRVNDRLTPWPETGHPRRAGVNSLGVGGTNAHAVLQAAPDRPASEEPLFPFQPLVVSARTRPALDAACARLAAHLRAHPEQPLADVAYTLKEGRRAFDRRRVVVAETHDQAARLLEGADPRLIFSHDRLGDAPQVVFLFPGGGAQYPGMARDLYATEPVFRDWMDRGLAVLQPRLDYDLRALWLPEPGEEAAAAQRLKRPSVQLPLILITELALARLYESWGVTPAALIGHSMGENSAACLAGVFDFEDAIALVHLRGQLFDTIPPGGMLSVPLAEEALRPRLGDDLDMASVNAPGLCVVSGPDAALARLAADLAAEGVETARIAIDIAAHSRMLDPILDRFAAHLRGMRLNAPRIPVISNRTGQPLTAEQATDPAYWVAHLRNTVLFAQGMATLQADPARVYVEMGPGRALSSLAQANGVPAGQVIPALRHPEQAIADDAWHVGSIARLWACGVAVDWDQIWAGIPRRRVPLPTYPFQRRPYFIDAAAPQAPAPAQAPLARIDDIARWGWRPVWRPEAAGIEVPARGALPETSPLTWLMFLDDEGLGAACADRLAAAGHRVVQVRAGDCFARLGDHYALAPERGREDYDALIRDLVARGLAPQRIVHFGLVTGAERFRPGSSFRHRNLEQGFHALVFLAQAVAQENLPRPLHVTAVTTGAARVHDEALAYPEKAMIAGPLLVMPRELPGLGGSWLDVVLPPADRRGRRDLTDLAAQVIEDLLAAVPGRFALRGARRYARALAPAALPDPRPTAPDGAVLITGGFGGIGLTLAADLAAQGAPVALLTRRPLPPPADWAAHLATHPPHDPMARRIRAVQALQAQGARVAVAVADVCNLVEMRAAVARVQDSLGPIRGVIHAAGVVDDAPLLAKTPARIEEVLAPKLHGTEVLDTLFPDGGLDWLVAFSSTSTVTAPAGQVDYVAANEYLNAWAASRAGGRTRVLALNWGIWTGVGMAAEALADRRGDRPLPPPEPTGQPVLTQAGWDAAGHRLFQGVLSTGQWLIGGHRTRAGQALIPGTGILDLAAQAMAAAGEPLPFTLRDVHFLRALDVADGADCPIRVRLDHTGQGHAFTLRSARRVQGRAGWALHAQAQVTPGAAPVAAIDPAAIAARCGPAETGPGLRSPQEEHLAFGPRWRVLRSRALGQAEGIARLTLPPDFAAEAGPWPLHPALMDLATGWAMGLIADYAPTHLWVPVSYAEVRVLHPLPADLVSWVRNAAPNRASDPTAVFDITLADPQGQVCVEVRGFTMHRLDGALTFGPPSPAEMEFDPTPGEAQALSPAEERLAEALALGIRAEDGPQAFARALAAGGPQVIVSSIDLPALMSRAEPLASDRPEGAAFDRPDLDTDYVAPRTDVERTLAGFFQDLLGVARVGVEDSFFDLGGHSLIAVRLFAMVKRAWQVDFPISVLFQAPTVARIAALIQDRIGPRDGPAPAAPAALLFFGIDAPGSHPM